VSPDYLSFIIFDPASAGNATSDLLHLPGDRLTRLRISASPSENCSQLLMNFQKHFFLGRRDESGRHPFQAFGLLLGIGDSTIWHRLLVATILCQELKVFFMELNDIHLFFTYRKFSPPKTSRINPA